MSRSVIRLLSGQSVKQLLQGRAKTRGGKLIFARCLASANQQHIVTSPFGPVDIPETTIHEYVLKNVPEWPDNTALVCGMSGREYSYEALQALSRKIAAGFLKSGLKPGQVVALLLPNLPEHMIALLGALQAGLVVSSINPLYGPDEICHQISNSDAAVVLTFPAKISEAQEAIRQIQGPNKPPLIAIHQPTDTLPDGVRSFMELLMVEDEDEAEVDKVKVKPSDLALLLYSSGTTGLPKGVRLTHRNIVANLVQVDHPEIRIDRMSKSEPADATACVLPFFHIYGLTVGAFTHLTTGAKLVTIPRFEPEMYLKALIQHKVNIAHVVPPLVQFLANHPAVTAKHVSSLQYVINGAAAISSTDAKKLLEKKKVVIMSGYGLTESSPVITSARKTVTNLTTVGCVVSGSEVKICDTETGEIIDPSKPGEICCRGPQIMQGYHKNDQATAETIKDGWLHTGDVGYFDKDGQLFIVDRIKELIKVKGFQVAPLELEEILQSHKDIADVAVIGKKDKRSGEVPVAFVVKNPGSKLTEKEVLDFVSPKVAEYKQLDSVVFLDSIPKNSTGKILRRELRETINKA
ncbi:AMP dependent coa ligase [Nesidiocoris tenuis]|uniref:AMP dependent coa ligase n=1 Tax=Nesidiocoris tenuis TaxID=355587 RepID=A0ABN7ANY4_9HEMI|nr:AMP dependent coa ligase [Nesidiocoris tenuis]